MSATGNLIFGQLKKFHTVLMGQVLDSFTVQIGVLSKIRIFGQLIKLYTVLMGQVLDSLTVQIRVLSKIRIFGQLKKLYTVLKGQVLNSFTVHARLLSKIRIFRSTQNVLYRTIGTGVKLFYSTREIAIENSNFSVNSERLTPYYWDRC